MINLYYDNENSSAHHFLNSIKSIEIEGFLFRSFQEFKGRDSKRNSLSDTGNVVFFDLKNLFQIEENEKFFKEPKNYFFTIISSKEFKEEDLNLIRTFNEKDNGFLGVLFSDLSLVLNLPILKNALFRVLNLPVIQEIEFIEEKLSNLLTSVGKEQDRLKKIHELLVPLRKISLEGINLFSKYNAGTSSGSEILDIFKLENELCVFLSSSSSYASSDFVLNLLIEMKGLKEVNKEIVSNKLNEASKKLKLLDKIPHESLGITILFIKLRGNILYGFNLNSSRIYSSVQGEIMGARNDLWETKDIDSSFFEKRLVREERILLFSSGLIRNKNELIGEELMEDIFKEEMETGPSNLINEIFFKLKENLDGEILIFDSSCVLIEVDKNAIIQV